MWKAEFLKELNKTECSKRALRDKEYHKSIRAHWGITAPETEKVIKVFAKNLSHEELIPLAQELWQTNLFDPMIAAAKILSLKKIQPSLILWKTILSFMPQVDGWALEDHLAHAAWKCLLEEERLLDVLESWTQHSNFWMRRATLVFTLPFAKAGRSPEQMLTWASGYASDSKWFIQKAIGWWLRVLGEHNPQRVVKFLHLHWHDLKSVAKKEATRKLALKWKLELVSLS